MKLRIKESLSLFDADKKYIIDVFSNVGRYTRDVPYSNFDSATWRDIVSDVREIFEVDDDMSLKDSIIENYNDENPDDELFFGISDVMDDIENNAHSSRFKQYANTVSLLLRGESFRW